MMKIKILMSILLVCMIVCVFYGQCFAATYYISPTGSDSNNGSSGSPWKTLSKACSTISGGDTVIVRDGTYSGSSNKISNLPSGSSGSYTIIKAENDGGAVLSGISQFINLTSDSYIQIEGFTLKDGLGGEAVQVYGSSYIKFKKVGIKNGIPLAARYGNVFQITEGSHHVLVEDCWIAGAMRYGFFCYSGSSTVYKVIFRRCIVRFDGNDEREPKSCFSSYGATGSIVRTEDILYQNCIAIDASGTTGSGAMNGAFAAPQSGHNNIQYQGCIALNIKPNGGNVQGFYWEKTGSVSAENCVAWDCSQTGMATRTFDVDLDNCTLGANAAKGWDDWDGSGSNNGNKCLFYQNTSSNSTGGTWTNNYFDGDSSFGSGAVSGNSGLQYIVQRSATMSDKGAEVLYKYGTNGTLYDESGYDTITGNDLWPFPYEDRIRTMFREDDSISGNDTTRGFCADGQTLTKYIWEYLGNTIPADIYGLNINNSSLADGIINIEYSQNLAATGGGSPYTWSLSSGSLPSGLSLNSSTGEISGIPPAEGTSNFIVVVTDANLDTATKDLSIAVNPPDLTAPVISNITAASITDSSVIITWTTNESATSQVEYGPTSGYGVFTVVDSELITSHSVSISGLDSNTTYHFRVISKDAADNSSTSGDNTFTTENYLVYSSTDPTLVLEGTTPEEGTMTVNITDDPANAISAELILTCYDPDNSGEGYIYVNENIGIELPWSSAYDGQEVVLDPISINKDWLVQGINNIRFTHLTTVGYQVRSLSIRLNFSGVSDTTAPATVSDLNASTGSSSGEIDLTWTASGDDGATGTAASYIIKYSTSNITNDTEFNAATDVSGEPSPDVSGTTESMTVGGLTAGQVYYFAMKTQDEVPNTSNLSNSTSAQAKETIIQPDTIPPYTTGHTPISNAVNVAKDTNIVVHVVDDGAGVDINTIVMRVNGAVVTPVITGTPADYTLTYNPPVDFNYGQTVNVEVEAQDLAN